MDISIFTKNLFYNLIVVLFLIFNSCISTKEVKYLQDNNNNDDTIKIEKRGEYYIQNNDYLYIKFSSIDPEINKLINPDNTLIGSGYGTSAKYKDIYVVNDSGYIELPLIDKIYVKDMTISQIKSLVENKINYRQVIVTIRLYEFPITIIGQVNKPGHYTIDKEKFTIFELIGMCGDLTINANRKNVKLLRETEQGTEVIVLDLTKKTIINSKYYYLKPYDMIYVEPHYATFLESSKFPFITTLSVVLTTTTSILFILNFFK